MNCSGIRETGYFDDVFSIFEAHDHPVVLVEDVAMRWMALALVIEEVSLYHL
jgi:hypothetical protein